MLNSVIALSYCSNVHFLFTHRRENHPFVVSESSFGLYKKYSKFEKGNTLKFRSKNRKSYKIFAPVGEVSEGGGDKSRSNLIKNERRNF